MIINEINISTKERYQLIDITDKVETIVKENNVKDGVVLVFVLHTTAGILLTENEEGLKNDWLKVLGKWVHGFNPEGEQVPYGAGFEHNKNDNNADSHILAGLIGPEKILPIEDGKLIRGTWQNIFLAEFDGPRTRKIIVKVFEV